MKNGVASPVLGVNLYENPSPCGTPPNGQDGWTLIGSFGPFEGSTGSCYPWPLPSETRWFATAVRVRGPSIGATVIETGSNV